LTWDHPLVTGAIDLLLGSEKGNSCFVEIPDAEKDGVSLEAVYVLECIAPPHLHIDRFLPPTPLRVVVDHKEEELPDTVLRDLLEQAGTIAQSKVAAIVNEARKNMNAQLAHEIVRLKQLRKVNRSVR